MSDIKISIQKTLVNEGGYVDNPNDSGGATKYGITQIDLDEWLGVGKMNVRDLGEDQAAGWYEKKFSNPLYCQIEAQDVCDKIFDMGVLFGVETTVRIFQTTLGIKADGEFGPASLSATNAADSNSLLASFKTNMLTHAFNIATINPKDRVFLKGWGNRINRSFVNRNGQWVQIGA